MKIAVTSQNRKQVTEHAGRCRKFWLYTLEDSVVTDKSLIEIEREQSFRDSNPNDPHPLDGVEVLITAGCGSGLSDRLAAKGTRVVITDESDPDLAVQRLLTAG